MGLRVVAIGTSRFLSPYLGNAYSFLLDTGAEKRDLAMKLGAEAWVDFRETKDLVAAIKAATGGDGPNVAVVTATNSAAYEQAIDYLRPGGTLMMVGLPGHGKLAADIFFTVIKAINIRGSYVG